MPNHVVAFSYLTSGEKSIFSPFLAKEKMKEQTERIDSFFSYYYSPFLISTGVQQCHANIAFNACTALHSVR